MFRNRSIDWIDCGQHLIDFFGQSFSLSSQAKRQNGDTKFDSFVHFLSCLGPNRVQRCRSGEWNCQHIQCSRRTEFVEQDGDRRRQSGQHTSNCDRK